MKYCGCSHRYCIRLIPFRPLFPFVLRFDVLLSLAQLGLIISSLKDKSGAVIFVNYSRDYTVVNGALYFFAILFSFNLRNCIVQSAKKCEITSFSMMSLHADLNDAAKCVDIIPITLLASLSRLHTHVQNAKWRRCLA